MRNTKKISAVILLALVLGISVINLIFPKPNYIDSERRPPSELPELNLENFLGGNYAGDFEKYATDSFVFRDELRELKAVFNYGVFRKLDNNDIYLKDGSMMKIEQKIDEKSVEYVLKKFENLYEKYLKNSDCKIYASIIPDKAYFAKRDGDLIPTYDYEEMFAKVKDGMPYAVHIDVTDVLQLSDFYLTDTHWRQEKIIPVAKKISEAMGNDYDSSFEEIDSGIEFRGVNSGHSALRGVFEKLLYLENKTIENCETVNLEKQYTFKDYDASQEKVYNLEKLESKDPYEVFLSGACAAVLMKNENAKSEKRLIVFRDSYGSSLAPLLLEDYSEILLLDIRYMASELVGEFADFENADVLFLYSTTLINSGSALK